MKKSLILLYAYVLIILFLMLVVFKRCKNIVPDVKENEILGDSLDVVSPPPVPNNSIFLCGNYKDLTEVKEKAKNLVRMLNSNLEIIANPRDYSQSKRRQQYNHAIDTFSDNNQDSIEIILNHHTGTKLKYSASNYLDIFFKRRDRIYLIDWEIEEVDDFKQKDEYTYTSIMKFSQTQRIFYKPYRKWKLKDADITSKEVELILKVQEKNSSCVLKIGSITAFDARPIESDYK